MTFDFQDLGQWLVILSAFVGLSTLHIRIKNRDKELKKEAVDQALKEQGIENRIITLEAAKIKLEELDTGTMDMLDSIFVRQADFAKENNDNIDKLRTDTKLEFKEARKESSDQHKELAKSTADSFRRIYDKLDEKEDK